MMENLSYRNEIGKQPLKYITLGQVAEFAALKYGDQIAVDSIEQNKRLTYREVLVEADTCVKGLLALGMQKGDKLGLWAPNCIEWYVFNWACARIGVWIVPLNPASTLLEIEHSINKVEINFIVCPYEGKYCKYYDVLMEIAPEIKTAKRDRFSCSKMPSLKGIILISDTQISNAYNYGEVIEMGISSQTQGIQAFANDISPDDNCYIHFSSGTTGKPKAVPLTHFQVANNAYVLAKRCELDLKHHVICVQVPLFHGFGTIATITAAAHFGATLVLPSMYYNSTKNFEAIIEQPCSYVFGTPTMFMDLVSIQQIKQKELHIEYALMGAAPCSLELFNKIKSVLKINNIKISYGLTETSTTVFVSLPDDQVNHNSAGSLCDHVEVKVIDLNGRIVPLGSPGEICIRGYVVTSGYWNDVESTKKAMGPDGWFKTGDLGILKENGSASIVGRLKDLIIRGGENIYPKEIEDLLSTHPNIVEVQVIGVPHERLGEEVCACVKLKESHQLTISQVKEFCRNKIAHFKVPTQLKIVRDFPKTASGKIQKGLLKEMISKHAL